MLARVFNFVEAYESALGSRPSRQSAFFFLHLAFSTTLLHGQSKLGVDEFEAKFATLVGLLERVHGSELEVHSIGMREFFEKRKQLDDIILLDHLNADRVGCPLLVDGNYHAST